MQCSHFKTGSLMEPMDISHDARQLLKSLHAFRTIGAAFPLGGNVRR